MREMDAKNVIHKATGDHTKEVEFSVTATERGQKRERRGARKEEKKK